MFRGHFLLAQSSPTPTDGELFGSGNYRETRPIFLVDSCSLLPIEEREACGQEFMVHYLYSNLRWPTPDDCAEGMVVVSWFIEEDGSISELRVVRGIHDEYDKESIRVIADLLQLYPWQPGMINDRPVRIQYNMPVRWRLE